MRSEILFQIQFLLYFDLTMTMSGWAPTNLNLYVLHCLFYLLPPHMYKNSCLSPFKNTNHVWFWFSTYTDENDENESLTSICWMLISWNFCSNMFTMLLTQLTMLFFTNLVECIVFLLTAFLVTYSCQQAWIFWQISTRSN